MPRPAKRLPDVIDNELDNTIWHSKIFRRERLEENILAVGVNHA